MFMCCVLIFTHLSSISGSYIFSIMVLDLSWARAAFLALNPASFFSSTSTLSLRLWLSPDEAANFVSCGRNFDSKGWKDSLAEGRSFQRSVRPVRRSRAVERTEAAKGPSMDSEDVQSDIRSGSGLELKEKEMRLFCSSHGHSHADLQGNKRLTL